MIRYVEAGVQYTSITRPKGPRYNMKCCGENVILRGIFHVVSHFPQHFVLYRGNLDCFSNSVHPVPGAEKDVGYQRVEDRGQQQRHQVEDGHVGEEQDLYTQSRL